MEQDIVENNGDVYAQFSPPKNLTIVGTVIGVATFVAVAQVTDSAAPFFAALSVGVVGMLVGFTWPLRHRKLLLIQIVMIALVHATVIALFHWPAEIHYGFLFAPLVGLDIFVSWKAIIAILKLFDRLSNPI